MEETEHGTRDTEQNLPWREVVRTAPPWIWLISSTALFGICAMFLAVMMLIAMGK